MVRECDYAEFCIKFKTQKMQNPFETIEARLSNIENLILDLKHSNIGIDKPEVDHWFNIQELCNYLPDKPKKRKIYDLTSENAIPFHKRKGCKPLYFLKREIDHWLKEGRKKTLSEIEEEANTYLKKKKENKK